jgi:hypothetical protein
MKVLDLDSLATIYVEYLRSRGIKADWISEKRRFEIGKDQIAVEREETALRLIFGSESPPLHPVLPFFLWGFDSV